MAGWYKLATETKVFDLNDGSSIKVLESFNPPSELNGWACMVPLEITGTESAETHQIKRDIQKFIASARDEVYLEYSPKLAINYKPVFGQMIRRFEILKWEIGLTSEYVAYSEHVLRVDLEITVFPAALGQWQIIPRGGGGIIDDNLCSVNKIVRGTIVANGITNHFTNPIFHYSPWGSWFNGWTVGNSLDIWQATEPENVLFGEYSCAVVRQSATAYSLAQNLTMPNTNNYCLSCFARRDDGGTIDATLFQMLYGGSNQTTTFIELINGWYLCYANVTGLTSSSGTGIIVNAEDIIFNVTGFQMEETTLSFPSPFAYGDMVGCVWASSAHASTTTRDDGELRTTGAKMFSGRTWGQDSIGRGTFRIAFRWHYPSTNDAGNKYIFDRGNFECYFNGSDDKIYLTDGTNTISSTAQSFSHGDLCVLHVVVDVDLIALYINGSLADSDTAFESFDATGFFYFGSDSSLANHSNISILDFVAWKHAASATEISNDYDDLYKLISSGDGFGRQGSPLLWHWTLDAGAIDTYQDSTHLDCMIFGGLPGDVEGETIYYFENDTSDRSLLIGLNTHDLPVSPYIEFSDLSGTVVGGAIGGEVNQQSVNTTAVEFSSTERIQLTSFRKAYYRKQLYVFATVLDNGSNLQARIRLQLSSAYVIYSDWKNIAANNSQYKQFLIGPLSIPDDVERLVPWVGRQTSIDISLEFIRTASGAANVNVDFMRAVIGKIAYIESTASSSSIFILKGNRAMGLTSTFLSQTEECAVRGDILELEPQKYNFMPVLSGDLESEFVSGVSTDPGYFFFIPRWVHL